MSSTDIEKLIVQMSADIKKFENAINRANGIAVKRTRAIEGQFSRMNKGIAAGFVGLQASAARAFALIGGAQGFRSLSDSATRIDNALKVAGLSGDDLERVYSKLFDSARKNAAPLETLVELYGRVSLVQGELGISSDQLRGFVDNIAVAIRASGKSSEEASGALLQLSQALGAGVVRAEEFTSIIEGAPTIALAAAAGIKEAGGSVATLRKLMLDGKLSSKAFFDGINAGAPILQDKLANSVLTIDQRLENLKTSLINAARQFNSSTGVAQTFGAEIDRVSAFVASLHFDTIVSELRKVDKAIGDSIATVDAWLTKISQASGLSGIGKSFVNSLPGDDTVKSYLGGALTIYSTDAVANRINQAFDSQIKNVGNLTEEAIRQSVLGTGKGGRLDGGATPDTGPIPPSRPQAVKPISLSDYKVPADEKGGKSKKSRANEYERELAQIQQLTAALQAETAAQAGLNPLVNDYGFAVEYARAKQDLLTAAQQAGVKVTPELEANIDKLATAYGNAVVESEKLTESQDRIRQAADDFKNTAKDVTAGFISDLRDGKSAAEALSGALQKVGDKLLDLALNDLFGLGGSSGGGVFGGIFKALGFANGGFTGSGNKYDPAGIVHKGEYVVPKAVVDKIGVRNIEKLMGGYANGGLVGLKASPPSGHFRSGTGFNCGQRHLRTEK